MNTPMAPKKRALVTGGSGAIGAAICRRLAQDGLHVIVHTHRARDAAERLCMEIAAAGGSAQVVQFDVTDSAAARAALEPLVADAPIQALVNNAGIHDDAAFPGMAPRQWARVIDVALNGFFNVTQPLTMAMVRSRWGRIVTISSVAALIGNRGQTNYAAAKAGLHAASKSLALELASRGITVNVVAPGIIESEMSAASFNAEAIARLVPMRRAGRPGEVADLVGFLVSEQAGYISGQVISVNGAMA